MIGLALMLAAQAVESGGYTPDEANAVAALMTCEKRYVDALSAPERQKARAAIADEASKACSPEEAALLTTLRHRFNPQAAGQAVQIVRDMLRAKLPAYANR